jgi:hypothetical protein
MFESNLSLRMSKVVVHDENAASFSVVVGMLDVRASICCDQDFQR